MCWTFTWNQVGRGGRRSRIDDLEGIYSQGKEGIG
jgi:hypothetical protein